MRRRPLRLTAAVGLLLVAAGTIWAVLETGVASPNAWIRHALVALADAWLVPDVRVGGFSMEGPTTVALERVRLVQDDTDVLSCERVVVSFGDLPEEGRALRIERIELDRPVFTFRRSADAATWKPVGFDPLLEPGAVEAPQALDAEHRLSEVLDLRLVRIRDGVLVFDDGEHDPLRLDGITLDLEATPEVGPRGQPGHRADLRFGQPPGLAVEARAFVDLDHRFAAFDAASLQLDLSDPAALANLSPGLQRAVERYALAGTLRLSGAGEVDLADATRTRLAVEGDIDGFHAEVGGARLPIESARLRAEVADGLARIEEARVALPGGWAALTQADLAVVEREVALAGDWELSGLPLHALVAGGSATQSVADGRGRLYLASDDLTLGLTADSLTVGAPGRPPAIALTDGAVRGAALSLADVLVDVEAVAAETLTVRLVREGGHLVGLPAPSTAGDAAGDAAPGASPWPAWARVDAVSVAQGALILGDGGDAWALRGLRAEVTDLGATPHPPLTVTLAPGGGVTGRAVGTLDLAGPRVDLGTLQVAGPLSQPALRALLPPDTRALVTDLLPAGQLAVAGSARIGGGTTLDLQATLTDAVGQLAGLQMPIDTGAAHLTLGEAGLSLDGVTLAGARGRLTIPRLTLGPTGDLALGWTAEALDLSRLRTAGGRPLGAGRLSSQGRVVGTSADGSLRSLTVLDTDVRVDGGPAGQLRWPSVTVQVGTTDGVRRLDARVAGPGDGRLALDSRWPEGAHRLDVERATLSIDLSGDARQLLPLPAQQALVDLRAGRLESWLAGALSLDDPVSASTLEGAVELAGGVAQVGDWRVPSVEATVPVRVSRGRVRVADASLRTLGGEVRVPTATWSIPDDAGDGSWRAEALQLGGLEPTGGGASAIEGRLDGNGELALALGEEGLTVRGGGGRVKVREGRLVTLPAVAALAQADDAARKAGDDRADARFRLDGRGVTFSRLDLDLGPVRYSGGGWMRWTGALDLSLEGRRDRRGLADLAARLVAWRVHGTTAAPQVQALPLGVDTRTFDQKGAEMDALDELDDDDLDALETAPERSVDRPARPDLDIDLDDFEGFE